MTAADARVPPLVGEFDLLPQALDAAADQFGDADAYVEGRYHLSYRQWQLTSNAVAARLVELGVKPGDVVAVMLPSSIDFAVAYAAIARLGAVTSAINTRLGPREVAAIFDRSRPIVAVGEPASPEIVIDVPVLGRVELQAVARASLAAARPAALPVSDSVPGDPVAIIWTSGTTGLPKGAWFDHRGLAAAVHTAGALGAPFDRRLVNTPFAHAGYMHKPWEQAAWGMCFVISPTPWTPEDTIALIASERITVAGGVPTQWAKIVDHRDLATADLSSLRIGVAATAPTPPELVERVSERLGCALVVRYAMTESPSITGTDPGDRPEVLYRTVGRPQSGVEIEIRDQSGAPVTPGVVGRVHLRSAAAMRGYWNDPEQTAQVMLADGWIRSGDLGWIDPEGNLVMAGRSGDMYIRGGYNVYPLEVENVLSEHPAVAQAAIIGVPAPVIGEIGVAYIVASTDEAPTLEELRAWCRARLGDYKAPDELRVIAQLPLTSMLKVDKAALRALWDAPDD
ncbi:MAG: class I adenylate-forming enzyme family protein [Acidimicrobiia bacterium]